MKTVSIILTKYSDWLSLVVYYLTGRGYTHAALSLDNGEPYFYSFTWKGFRKETVEKYRKRGVTRMMQIQLKVDTNSYNAISRRLLYFENFSKQYHYTRFGVFCALLHLPFRWHGHYFCSQFVAEVLEASGAIQWRRPACCYLPNQFWRELSDSPCLVESRTHQIGNYQK